MLTNIMTFNVSQLIRLQIELGGPRLELELALDISQLIRISCQSN